MKPLTQFSLPFWYFGLSMSPTFRSQPLTAEDRILSLFSPCRIYGGRGVTGTCLFPSTWGFPCHHHSTIALTVLSPTLCNISH
jgi:hypothetical protein